MIARNLQKDEDEIDPSISTRARNPGKQSGARRRRNHRPWKKISAPYRKNLWHLLLLPLMHRMKNIVGGTDGMDFEFAHYLKTYAESGKKQGVTTERCLFNNPMAVFGELDLDAKYRKQVVADVKNAISPNELMITLSEIGVGPHALRKLTKGWKEKKYDIFHGERVILKEKKNELEQAYALLGEPQKIELTLKTIAKDPNSITSSMGSSMTLRG